MRCFKELLQRLGVIVPVLIAGWSLSACKTFQGAPDRLYAVDVETQAIRESIKTINLSDFSSMTEMLRVQHRNDWIGARMYAIDLNYTTYEADFTRERQGTGFAASAATIGLTTASGLLAPVATKNLLTGLAGFVTGTRAAYDSDVLLAHSTQWIQSQMRTQRSLVADQIFRGMRKSTSDYTLAEALTDLEEYYRAGTFTGGVLATSDTLGAEAKFAESLKAEKLEIAYVSTAVGGALRECILRRGSSPADQRALLNKLMGNGVNRGLTQLMAGKHPAIAEDLLRRARIQGIC